MTAESGGSADQAARAALGPRRVQGQGEAVKGRPPGSGGTWPHRHLVPDVNAAQ